MRMQNWAKALLGLLGPLVVCSTTYAQQPPGYGPPPGGYPDPYLAQAPMNPGVFQPPFGSNGAQGLPPSALPYPAISPHLGPNVLQSQTFQQDGSWVNRIINNDRDWYFTTEYLHTDFEGPGGHRIGSRTAPLDRLTDDFPQPGDPWQLGSTPPVPIGSVIPIGPGAFPFFPQVTDVGDWAGVVEPGGPPQAIYPIRSADILDDVLSSNGVRLRGGYFDGDGTGMQMEFWWAFGAEDAVQYGSDNIRGIPITQELITGQFDPQFDVYPNDLTGDFGDYGGFLLNAKIGAVPYEDNGALGDFFFPGTGINGFLQKYDLLFRVDTNLNVGGGNLNFYLGELYRRPHVSIKSFSGLKYMYVDERFGFRGIDSGFNYTVDELTGTPLDGEYVGPFHPIFESILNATVTSHLAGPELGLRGDLGKGGTFAVWWQGSLGLMVNHENARIQGNNIGAAYYYHTNFGDPSVIGDESGAGTIFGPEYDMFASDTSFDSTEQHTHISPTLNLGINAEIGILDAIPGIRRISLFDDAKLNVGYNMQYVGLMAKAADSIRWRGFPEFPSAQIDYDTWAMHQLSIGLHFER